MKILFILSNPNTSTLPQGLRSQFGHECKVEVPSNEVEIEGETDIVVLDHTLPKARTKELVKLISARAPSIPIVEVMSETFQYPYPSMAVRYKPPGSVLADGYSGTASPLSWSGEEYFLRQALAECTHK